MMDGLSHLSQAWLQYFGAAVVQNTVFLGLVFAALYLLRNASGQTRYIIATIGLVKLLLPPFVPFAGLTGMGAASPVAQTVVTLVRGGDVSAVSPPASPVLPNAALLLFLVWIAVALGYISVVFIRTHCIVRSLKTATPLEDPAVPPVPRFQSIRFFESDRITMPLTVGVFPRRIFLPVSWQSWSPAFRDAVVRHEVAHIARFDGLIQLAQTLAGALYFFHPLVWVLNKRLRTYREMACDDSSVRDERISRLEYSKCLVEVAERTVRYTLACESVSALLWRRTEILDRVRYQTKEGIMRSVPRRKLSIALAVLLCCVVSLSWYVGTPDSQPSKAVAKTASSGMSVVEAQVKSAQSIRIGDTKTSLDGLKVDLRDLIDRDPDDVVIHLKCAGDLPMSVLFGIQNILIDNGFTKVTYENYDNAQSGRLPLVLPSRELEKKMKTIPPEDIAELYVRGTGDIVFEDQKVSAGDLAGLVDARLQQNPYLIVSIHAEPQATFADFVEVLTHVKLGNAQRIFIAQPAS